MATNWAVQNIKTVNNAEFIQIAEKLTPNLLKSQATPVKWMVITDGEKTYESGNIAELEERTWGRGDSLAIDFGHHGVGYLSFQCRCIGSPQDAPAFIKLKFCEIKQELSEESDEYDGWISKGWIQEEWLHIDYLPEVLKPNRRYAFRYLKIDVLDTSQKYRIAFHDFMQEKVSAVNMEYLELNELSDSLMQDIDEAALRTLQNCMQTVFEDGPKRDRRLWLGDLRLQALVNYKSFQNYDLVKRCLYLFAGMVREDGMIAACLFTQPKPLMDDTFLLDYSLFFISTLLDYFIETKDKKTLQDLAGSALKQLEFARIHLDEKNIICGEGKYHCFIDWNENLDKQCGMQAIYLYSLKDGAELCRCLGDYEQMHRLENEYEELKKAALQYLWDKEEQVFISGDKRQVSIASQIWMIEAMVVEGREAANLLERVKYCPIKMVTPYMNHFYISALIKSGEYMVAKEHLKKYWGGMIKAGADTFWELFLPDDLSESPYGSSMINSYCHAWSCTPAYFFRKYDFIFAQ